MADCPGPDGTRMLMWRAARAVLVVAVFTQAMLACTDDPGSDGVSDAVAALVADPSDPAAAFADVVELVARDGISDDDAAIVAANLDEHLDILGDSATSGGPISRPDTVRFFAALIDGEQGERVHLALASWSVDVMSSAIGAGGTLDAIVATFPPAVAVVAAAKDGDDRTDTPGGLLFASVTDNAEVYLSRVVSDAHGVPRPNQHGHGLFNRSTLGFDVVTTFASEVIPHADSLDDDDPWAAETST